ncbi:MAG: ribosome maturation factor RimM [Myxococcota bacterium]|nr:ribosome maturation factor RimM [Myxococcota bacterium]
MPVSVGRSELVEIGFVEKAHGIRGEVKVRPFVDAAQSFVTGRILTVRLKDGSCFFSKITHVKSDKGNLILKLSDVLDRTAAEGLKGSSLSLDVSALPAVEHGEYFLFELEGVTVVSVGGGVIGQVTGFMAQGAQFLLRISSGDVEHLIPHTIPFVVEFRRADRVLRVDLPEGFLELAAQVDGIESNP